MRTRPVLATTAAVAAIGLCIASSSASAATATPAKGKATSVLSLLQVTAAGHALRVGDLTLSSDTLTGKALSSISVTPVVADGTAIGQQSITPANSPLTSPSASSPGALAGLLSVTSPVFGAAATTLPSAQAGAASLGSLKVLGLTVPLNGTLDLSSAVNKTTGAVSSKQVVISGLALPSIADLLAALGLDLTKLPVATLNTLVTQLGLVTSAISTAQAAASSALAQVTAATATLATATGTLTSATSNLTSATTTLQGLLSQIPAANLIGLPAGSNTVAGFLTLPTATQTLLAATVPGTAAAVTAVTTAQGLVTTATAAVATAQAALTSLTAALQAALAPLLALLTGVLDSTPLLSIDKLSISSKALASSNKAGGQQAQVLGGTLTGLHVLGTDVLDSVLGTSSINLVDLVGSTATQLTSTINGLTGTLSSVLSSVPGLPTLKIPAPQITLLTKTAVTSISGGFGRASTSVTGLKIALPAITLPSAIALPGAAALPGLSLLNGLLTSSPITMSLATLSDQAAFAPAVVAAPTTPTTPTTGPTTPTLPTTGLPAGLAVLALLSIGGALVVRRRLQA
ncbi:MAG: hypothetical protein JWL79_754 [Frankiales bacterium]|nr:hypothetical protein [Frankiales bacterium]